MSLETTFLTEQEKTEIGESLLDQFYSFSKQEPLQQGQNRVVLSQFRAPIMRQLGDLDYKPAAQPIFEYLQTTNSTSELTIGMEALVKLNYTEAIPFIESQLQNAERWYMSYRNHSKKPGKDLVKKEISVAREALKALNTLKSLNPSSASNPSGNSSTYSSSN